MKKIFLILISLIMTVSLFSCKAGISEAENGSNSVRIDIYEGVTGLILDQMNDDMIDTVYDGMGRDGKYIEISCIQYRGQDAIANQLDKSDIWAELPYMKDIDIFLAGVGVYDHFDFNAVSDGKYTLRGKLAGDDEYERTMDRLDIWDECQIAVWDAEKYLIYLINISES